MNSVHAKFFPPTRPVCAFTRDELEQMAIEHLQSAAGRQKRKRKPYVYVYRARKKKIPPVKAVGIRPNTPANKILVVAAMMFGISIKDILGTSQEKLPTKARFYAIRRMRFELDMGWTAMGRLLNRDHASIINAVRPKGKKG